MNKWTAADTATRRPSGDDDDDDDDRASHLIVPSTHAHTHTYSRIQCLYTSVTIATANHCQQVTPIQLTDCDEIYQYTSGVTMCG